MNNGLQSGTSASDLAPQSFKNSLQTGSLQGTLKSSKAQSSSASLAKPFSGTLKVVGKPGDTTVLGDSTQPVAAGGSLLLPTLVAITACVLFFVFLRKFIDQQPHTDEK